MSNDVPFTGKTILITRPLPQARSMAERITALGGTPLLLPTTEIRTQSLPNATKQAIEPLSQYDWLVFTSANGVKGFFYHYLSEWKALPANRRPGIAVVGNRTQKAVEELGLTVDFVPEKHNAQSLAETFAIREQETILWPCGNLAKTTLAEVLRAKHVSVQPLTVYETHIRAISPETLEDAIQQSPDAILFTSPSSIAGFFDNLRQHGLSPGETVFACIGETTAEALIKQGLKPHVIAKKPSEAGLLTDLAEYLNNPTANTEI